MRLELVGAGRSILSSPLLAQRSSVDIRGEQSLVVGKRLSVHIISIGNLSLEVHDLHELGHDGGSGRAGICSRFGRRSSLGWMCLLGCVRRCCERVGFQALASEEEPDLEPKLGSSSTSC